MNSSNLIRTGLEVAVIGMAGRFPGAPSIADYWHNLKNGRESLVELSDDHLRRQGVSEAELGNPNFIRVGGLLEEWDRFDANLFGYSPREAEILDPQHRLFLECAWTALEAAGYDPNRYLRPIGVFGGAGMNGYLLNLYSNSDIRQSISPYELFVGNDKDFLTTRVSYKLNLTGPSVTVQTACSSSLVAVHMASQSLLAGECDMALAGGVAVSKLRGYVPQQGNIYAHDGHCRAFDRDATGTVAGNGVGLVVLKRFEDAIHDGDSIDAVIRGSAVTNDGAQKVSYTAPQVESQAAAIRQALARAEVNANTVTYIEAHGTGTRMGDPIEIAALTQAFREQTDRRQYCRIGSVKTNIGHLDAAAGIASLIKTVLALKHRQIPPSLHFNAPNPQIDFSASPFMVNAELTQWTPETTLLRAGVSSFGIGGTNAHVVLEEYQDTNTPETITPKATKASGSEHFSEKESADSSRTDHQLVMLPLSAQNREALSTRKAQLADFLRAHPATDLRDVAFTLHEGRQPLPYRIGIQAHNTSSAIGQLSDATLPEAPIDHPSIVFLLPGQGSRPQETATLFQDDATYQRALDACKRLPVIADTSSRGPIQRECIDLFCNQFSLAQVLKSYGVVPTAILGHSFGEIVAACLAEVFSLEDALRFVSLRASLMDNLPPGAMTVAQIPSDQVSNFCHGDVSLAAVNSENLVTLTGPPIQIEQTETQLAAENITFQRLSCHRAFHSQMTESIKDEVTHALSHFKLKEPKIPFISCVTGTWISPAEATSSEYWGRQLRQTVQFATGIKTTSELHRPLYIQLGSGKTLTSLVRDWSVAFDPAHSQEPSNLEATHPAHSVGGANRERTSNRITLDVVSQLWRRGVNIEWPANQVGTHPPKRVPLPTYPFQGQKFWVAPDDNLTPNYSQPVLPSTHQTAPSDGIHSWIYQPIWQRRSAPLLPNAEIERSRWLIFANDEAQSRELSKLVEKAGNDVFQVRPGDQYEQTGFRQFTIRFEDGDDMAALFADLRERDSIPEQIVYHGVAPCRDEAPQDPKISKQEDSITGQPNISHAAPHGLLQLLLQLADLEQPTQLSIVTTESEDVIGTESICEQNAAWKGIALVAAQEHPQLGIRIIDLEAVPRSNRQPTKMLWNELRHPTPNGVVAHRGRYRWEFDYESAEASSSSTPAISEGNYFLIGDVSSEVGRAWARSILDQSGTTLAIIHTDQEVAERYRNAFTGSGRDEQILQLISNSLETLENTLERATEQFGSPKGIFICGPTANTKSAAPLTLLDENHWTYNSTSRIEVSRVVARFASDRPIKFICVQSSMSAVLGGIGLAAYSASNLTLEAFVSNQNRNSQTPWYSIGWDAIHTESEDNTTETPSIRSPNQDVALNPEEVWEATNLILSRAAGTPFAVSRIPLERRLQEWVQPTWLGKSPDNPSSGRRDLSERPELSNKFVAPRNELEKQVAEIWEEMLKIQGIGVQDNFFALGGHSLLAIQIIGRLRDTFNVDLEIRHLIADNPTPETVATQIAETLRAQSDVNQPTDLVAEIESMSDEDIQSELRTNQ